MKGSDKEVVRSMVPFSRCALGKKTAAAMAQRIFYANEIAHFTWVASLPWHLCHGSHVILVPEGPVLEFAVYPANCNNYLSRLSRLPTTEEQLFPHLF